MEKILFLNSQKTEYPVLESVLKKYQTQILNFLQNKKDLDSIIKNIQPQVIIFDEHIPINFIKKFVNKYPFIPFIVIGEIVDAVKLEKLLDLGVNLIRIPITEKELESNLSNILWFSLSKSDLWQQEMGLVNADKKQKIFYSGLKVFLGIFIFVSFLFSVNKVYNRIITKKIEQKIYFEVDLPYVTPSDITFLNGSYLISDWNIRNIFQHDVETDKMVGMFVPENKFNSISSFLLNKEKGIITSSVFFDKIYFYKYPYFDIPFHETMPIKNSTIISLHIDRDKLFILDNNRILYEFIIKDNFDTALISSKTITEFLPVDIYVYENYFYILNNNNILYKFTYPELEKVLEINLNTFFDSDKTIVSFAINESWLYLLSEQEKKVYKISRKILT